MTPEEAFEILMTGKCPVDDSRVTPTFERHEQGERMIDTCWDSGHVWPYVSYATDDVGELQFDPATFAAKLEEYGVNPPQASPPGSSTPRPG